MQSRTQQTRESAPIDPPTRNPRWWTDGHASAWERVKAAFRRDWEQTKADMSSDGQTLNQNIGDTVKQAMGTEPIPPDGVKTHPTDPRDTAKDMAQVAARDAEQRAEVGRAVAKSEEDAAKRNFEATKAATAATVKAAEETAKREVEAAKAATKAEVDAAAKHVDAVKNASKAREAMNKETANATAAIGAAGANIAGEYAKIDAAAAKRDEAIARWNEAEQEARYGYAARSQYAPGRAWDDALEGRLRTEWDALGTGRTWEHARAGVRRGWDHIG